jgi:7-cyano-7-deazaguanine synthase
METNLVLLSGGIDSIVCSEMLKNKHKIVGIGFDYNQPHKIELEYAKEYCNQMSIEYSIKELLPIEKIDNIVFSGRNAILLANAFSLAYKNNIKYVTIGVNKDDSELFSDCRKSFIDAMATVAEAYSIELLAPLIDKTKKEVIELSKKYDIDINSTWTCYFPTSSKERCGKCYSCIGLDNAKN